MNGRSDGTDFTSPLRGKVGAQRRVRGTKLSPRSVKRARALRQNETDAERVFWSIVRNRGVNGHKFVRQYPVGPYIVDFACRDAMLVVEIDGGQHAQSLRDETRTRYLNEQGYSVLRFWNGDVLTSREGCWQVLSAVLEGNPSPDLRFAPATLSPEGRGGAAAISRQTKPIVLAKVSGGPASPRPSGERSARQRRVRGSESSSSTNA